MQPVKEFQSFTSLNWINLEAPKTYFYVLKWLSVAGEKHLIDC